MLLRAVAVVAGVVGACASAFGGEPVRVALTATTQSFSSADSSGGLSGFNVEIINDVCRRIDRKCELKEMPFRDILPAVAAGTVDIGVANMLKTPERAKQALFTVPYWRSTTTFIGKTGASLPPLTDLLNKHRVCAIAATRQDGFLRGLPGASETSVVALPSNRETLTGLRDGACDFALVPTMQALPFLQSEEGIGFAFRGLPLMDHGLGGEVHMVVSPGKPELLKEVNAALTTMIRQGAHERISRRYFSFSIL